MDADIISFETMLANRDAADWAFGSMIASFLSFGATLLAAFIALRAINGWKGQARSQEIKNLTLAVYNYHMAVIRGPEIVHGQQLDDFGFRQLMFVYDALSAVYQATLLMHETGLRGRASTLFNELASINEAYLNASVSKTDTDERILQIRKSNLLLNSSH